MSAPDEVRARWVLRRACRLSPAQLALGCALPGVAALVLGLVFAVLGYPWMAAFALAEIVVLALAFVQHARHVGDCEVITLEPGRLRVQWTDGALLREQVLPRDWLRIEQQADPGGLIELHSGPCTVCVGRHLPAAERARLRRELRTSLQASGAS
jgi:uncharacterized membrane protein